MNLSRPGTGSQERVVRRFPKDDIDLDAIIADVESRPASDKVVALKRSTFDALITRIRQREDGR